MKISELAAAPLPDENMVIAFEFVDGQPHRHITVGEYLRNKLSYSHRNGETESPTISGRYWFSGIFNGHLMADVVSVSDGGVWSDAYDPIGDYDGQWWGPLVPPWETP